jgi:hypothetical protein
MLLNKSLSLTKFFVFEISCKVIVRMRTLLIRPAPLCIREFSSSSFGVDEPVKIYCPFFPELSTACLMASQTPCATCHSSIKRGFLPSNTDDGSKIALFLFEKLPLGSDKSNSVFAKNLPHDVFPHHFGPSMTTAPLNRNFS